MKQLKALILAAATLVAAQAWAADDAQADKIRDRIKPVGTVCVGAECGGAVVSAAAEPQPRKTLPSRIKHRHNILELGLI